MKINPRNTKFTRFLLNFIKQVQPPKKNFAQETRNMQYDGLLTTTVTVWETPVKWPGSSLCVVTRREWCQE